MTEVADLNAVIDYAISLSYVEKNNILLMGCNQGGFVSGLTAAKWKDKIKNLVMFYPALCIPGDARSGKMMFARFAPITFLIEFTTGL